MYTIKSIMKSDKTVVLVSHNSDMISRLCDRVVWIEDMRTNGRGS